MTKLPEGAFIVEESGLVRPKHPEEPVLPRAPSQLPDAQGPVVKPGEPLAVTLRVVPPAPPPEPPTEPVRRVQPSVSIPRPAPARR